MKSNIKFIMLAISILVLGVILTYQATTLKVSKQAIDAQKETLYEMQSEFKQQDLTTLDGEIVSSSEAVSLTRKYRTKCKFYVNGEAIQPDTLVSNSKFSKSSRWLVTVEFDANDVLKSISFNTPAKVSGEPKDVAEAKQDLAELVGATGGASWQTLMKKVEDFVAADKYREQFAALADISSNSSWDDVLTMINRKLNGDGNTTVLQGEKIALSAQKSSPYSLKSLSFCYYSYEAGQGFILIDNGSILPFANAETVPIEFELNPSSETINKAFSDVAKSPTSDDIANVQGVIKNTTDKTVQCVLVSLDG